MDDLNKIYQGNTLETLKGFPDNSIDCSISSPPYWGLRAYPNSEAIWDATAGCQHNFSIKDHKPRGGGNPVESTQVGNNRDVLHFSYDSTFCSLCGAWKGQLGLEPDFKMFIKHLCDIYDEVRRVLKTEGTCWVNMGDTYNGNKEGKTDKKVSEHVKDSCDDISKSTQGKIKPKCLLQIPERFAIEMCDRGWILRNKIIWHKPNHMPSSVKDRLASSYEVIYFFVKSKKYYFDLDAIRVSHKYPADDIRRMKQDEAAGVKPFEKGTPQSRHWMTKQDEAHHRIGTYDDPLHTKALNPAGKNPGDIIDDYWTITTQPHPFAHFAVYPERLIEMPLKAGCPEGGIVLDPFMGSGTTAVVAEKQNKKWIGCEINPDYIKIAEQRLKPLVSQNRLPINNSSKS